MEFSYELTEKFTIWRMKHYTVEANNQEEADNTAASIFFMRAVSTADHEELMEHTMQEVDPGENDNQATAEMTRVPSGEVIANNT